METRSLYVHIPFCESICSYCDFCKVYYDQKQSDLYLQRLNEELSQIEQHHLKTIYIGGGTPSALNDEQLEKLMSMLKTYSLEVEEYCMEVNPESMDYYKLKILKKSGINRLSIGVQTFQDHLWHDQRAYATGVNQIVMHGYPYSGIYKGKALKGTQWPGFTGFESYKWSNSWGERQPNWKYASNYLDYLSRIQMTLRQGTPKVDVAVYHHSYYETIDFWGPDKIF